jgi:hypothetical protein
MVTEVTHAQIKYCDAVLYFFCFKYGSLRMVASIMKHN